ncbi:MAG TPA: hypothetical protein VF585_11485, partial [Chthoniobacterales bacterium]
SLASTAVAGDALIEPDLNVSIASPAGWELKMHGDKPALFPSTDRSEGISGRRVHITTVRAQGVTLEEAVQREIDRVTARSPARGSSADKKRFVGATPVRTLSGIEGLKAEFGGGGNYTINKFYFRHHDGRMFTVCAHVYSNRAVAEEIEKITLEGLSFAPTVATRR